MSSDTIEYGAQKFDKIQFVADKNIRKSFIQDGVLYDPVVPCFEALWNHPEYERRKFINCVGGKGSGKSKAIVQHLCRKMLTETGNTFLITRKSMTDLRKTVYQRGTPSIVRQLNEYGVKYYHNKVEGYMNVNGNDIFFAGMEDPDSLRSMNLNYAWMEEVTDFDWEDFSELHNRTRKENRFSKNHIYMSSNPSKSWHWSVQHFYLNPLPKYQQNCIYQRSTPMQNPYLPDDAIADLILQSEYDKNLYRINVLGEPGLPEGLVYSHIEQMPEEDWPQQVWSIQPVYGIDWGVNHPTVILEGRLYKRTWYMRQRYFASDTINYQILGYMQEQNKKWKEHVKPQRSLCESEEEYIDQLELWEAGKFTPNPHDFKAYGYDKVSDLLPFNFDPTSRYWVDHQPDFYKPLMDAQMGYVRKARKQNVLAGIMTVKKYRIIFSSRATESLQQMYQYSWVKKKGDTMQRDEPEKVEDDAPDCTRYICHSEETYSSTGGGFLGSTTVDPGPKSQLSTQTSRKPKSRAVYVPPSSTFNDPYDGW